MTPCSGPISLRADNLQNRERSFVRHSKKNSVLVAVIAALALAGGGSAAADSGAHGSTYESSGFLSGNVIQLPINAPINVCGNTLNVIGLLNPAFASMCGDAHSHAGEHWGSGGHDHDDSTWEESGCPEDEPKGYDCCECVDEPMPEPTDEPMPEPTETLPAPAASSALHLAH
ncbi:chaplin [Streptomyces sp. NPDC056254]|uniref:chaplin n=1 Tax=Streptomyces sp. NPDC056254 TaxID=3345763 RepID=UPI0035DEBFC7